MATWSIHLHRYNIAIYMMVPIFHLFVIYFIFFHIIHTLFFVHHFHTRASIILVASSFIILSEYFIIINFSIFFLSWYIDFLFHIKKNLLKNYYFVVVCFKYNAICYKDRFVFSFDIHGHHDNNFFSISFQT